MSDYHDRQEFELDTSRKPLELQLDPRGEILARFYAQDDHPKRSLRFQAQNPVFILWAEKP